MSEKCPVLTDKDIELMGRFRDEIAKIQADKNILFEECDIKQQSGGGYTKKLIENISYVIVLCIVAVASGATSAFLVTIIPQEYQMYILSFVNGKPTLPMCGSSISTTFYATFWSTLGAPHMSCGERAKLFHDGIDQITQRIGYGVAAVTGVSMFALQNKVEKYITGIIDRQSVPAIENSSSYSIANLGEKTNINERGGRRSRNGKRKYRKSRKLRRNKNI